MALNKKKSVVLAIIDGWGISTSWAGNAIAMANPSEINQLWKDYPHAVLRTFFKNGQSVGNSEVGHSIIGAGRNIPQNVERISRSIDDKTFFQNEHLIKACKDCSSYNSSLHLIGLVSDGGVHSHINHLFALLQLAKFYNLPKVYIHVITDGVDVKPNSALKFIDKLEDFIKEIGIGEIATISGRHYAMSRENNKDGIAKTLSAICKGDGPIAKSAAAAINDAYNSGLEDRSIPPTIISEDAKLIKNISNNDSVIFFNFRSDRARQLTLGLLGMNGKIKVPAKLNFVAFASYFLPEAIQKKVKIAFPPILVHETLGKIISDQGLTQFRITESEKYPHISYFFNCGKEEMFPGEVREIVQSNDSKSFAEKPEMQALAITEKLTAGINSGKFDFILVNYANVDLVGHSGDLMATAKAVSCIDEQVKKITSTVLQNDGILIITADHGNAEKMIQAGDLETSHTLNPVPFILIGKDFKGSGKNGGSKGEILTQIISANHSLVDIAPTILELLQIQKPESMQGKSLLSDIIK